MYYLQLVNWNHHELSILHLSVKLFLIIVALFDELFAKLDDRIVYQLIFSFLLFAFFHWFVHLKIIFVVIDNLFFCNDKERPLQVNNSIQSIQWFIMQLDWVWNMLILFFSYKFQNWYKKYNDRNSRINNNLCNIYKFLTELIWTEKLKYIL